MPKNQRGIKMTLEEIKNNSTYTARKAVLMEIAQQHLNSKYNYKELDYRSWDIDTQVRIHSTIFIDEVDGFHIYKHSTRILYPQETKDGRTVCIEIWTATKYNYEDVIEEYTAYQPE